MVNLLSVVCGVIGAMVATASSVPEPSAPSHPIRRLGTGTSKTWLPVMMLMLQQNKKISEQLEKVMADNENATNALQRELEILRQKIQSQPRSIRCYLGMKFGDIPDSALLSSSRIDVKHSAARARLDIEMTGDDFRGAWSASRPVNNEWIEADLGKNTSIAGVILQGRSDMNEWVKSYKVRCDSVMIQEYGTDKIFTGNSDRNTKVVGKFMDPIYCKVVRIEPVSYNHHVALRFELISGHCFDEF